MAGREKKPALIKKQNISTALSKDSDNQLDNTAEKTTPMKNAKNIDETSPVKKVIRAKKTVANTKQLKNKINKIKFKAKAKNVKKIKLVKPLFKNKKVIETKIVKNGIKKRGRPKGSTAKSKEEKAKEENKNDDNEKDLPPVLEAMTTTPDVSEKPQTPKKEPKKRTKKQIINTEDAENVLPIDPKKIKVEVDTENETLEDVLKDVESELDLVINPLVKKPGKRVTKNVLKPARKPPTPRKPKAETPKAKKGIKKDIIIDKLSKDIDIDSDAQSVINKLDLNVSKNTIKKNVKKRRHSIEKFNSVGDLPESSFETPFAIFSPLRSGSPKTRRGVKRQSVDRKQSPYSTRSDSPARILRNGKHRKLKQSQLLAGIEYEYKRRKRLGSEVSSTNDISKFSDDLSESDSNFSDMTNVTENGTGEDGSLKDEVLTKSDLLRKEILDSITTPPGTDELQNLNIKQISNKFTAILKRSLSTDTPQLDEQDIKLKDEELDDSALIDTNSNDLLKPHKVEILEKTETLTEDELDEEPISPTEKTELTLEIIKTEKPEPEEKLSDIEKIVTSPSYKVPEKLFILDQMKQNFNDNETEIEPFKKIKTPTKRVLKLSTSEDGTERTIETVTVAKFYGEPMEEQKDSTEIEEKPEEKILEEGKEEIPEDAIEKLQEELELMVQDKNETVPPKTEEQPVESEETIENLTVEIEQGEALINENNNQVKEKETVSEEKMEVEEEFLLKLPVEELNEAQKDEEQEKEAKEQEVEDEEANIEEKTQTEKEIVNENEELTQEIAEEDKGTEVPMNVAEEKEEVEEQVEQKSSHLDILNKLRENTSLSICLKPSAEFKSKSGSESGESISGSAMANMVNEAIKKLDEDKSESMSIDSSEETKEKNENCLMETNSEKSYDASELNINLPSTEILETPENMAIKENILSALGLRSLKAAEEDLAKREKQKAVNSSKNDVYTGTLKTVIKLNRSVEKKKDRSKDKERNPLKMTLQKSKGRSSKDGDCDNSKFDGASGKFDGEGAVYKVMKETSSSSTSRHSTDTVGANRKSHYSNRSNLEGDQHSDNDNTAEGESGTKELVIPEKASSFSIHPDRLCSDTCAYCFGKFGLFDTPLHIAQIKSVERQSKILSNEFHLTKDSCLCDACYRHVDRKATTGASSKSLKRSSNSAPHVNYCQVLGCDHESTNMLRRKWLLKMKKSILKLVNIDLENPSLHSIPVCSEHYAAVEHLMVCALCKRRLTRNHIHYLASECDTLNAALQKEGIPVTLTDKPLVCKLCRYFSSLLLKPPPSDSTSNTAEFFRQYKKRLLQYYDIEVPEEDETSDNQNTPKEKDKGDKKKKKLSTKKLNTSNGSSSSTQNQQNTNQNTEEADDQSRVPLSNNDENGESRASTPSDTLIDYEALVPNLSLECSNSDVDDNNSSNKQNTNNEVPQRQQIYKKLQLPESVREAVEISKIMNKVKKQDLIGKLENNPSISVRQLFQGEEDLPLFAHLDFDAVKDRTPEGWEKSVCTIQYSSDTKQLWQELQKPYGNTSSFLRHLILLEKYFRNGDLTLSPSASHHAVNYSVSVQNRLRAYDNIPSGSVPMQPLTMLPFNQTKKSNSGIITTREPPQLATTVINAANLPKNTPIPISQLNLNPNLLTQLSVRQKTPSVPPGLISIQQNQKPKPQKWKFPANKNWKPTLIPITAATTVQERRLAGLVQVISGGKPYHITLQDYNKMCYLRKTQEMRRQSEAKKLESTNQPNPNIPGSVLKPIVPRMKPKPIQIAPKPLNKELSATITAVPIFQKAKEPLIQKASNESSLTVTKEPNSSSLIKENKISFILNQNNPSPPKNLPPVMILPKIPKSLTVIPQTVSRKPIKPPSPTLSIITKPSTSTSNSNNNNKSS